MTKAEIKTLITRRLGDPLSTQFGDRAWDYFEQEAYRLLSTGEGFSGDEIQAMRGSVTTPLSLDQDGQGDIDVSVLTDLYQIERVAVDNMLAENITADEYYKAVSHPFFKPYGDETKYFRVGNVLKFVSGIGRNPVYVTVWYFKTLSETIADTDTVNLGRHIILDCVEKAVIGLKQEIGMVVQ